MRTHDLHLQDTQLSPVSVMDKQLSSRQEEGREASSGDFNFVALDTASGFNPCYRQALTRQSSFRQEGLDSFGMEAPSW